ncbi:MAG: magnesium transporter CorA family protein [Acidimicrobiales bacterium]
MAAIHTRAYTSGKLSDQDFTLDLVSEHLEDEHTIVWVDFERPTPADLSTLTDELGIHELAVEDALESHKQRPKVDFYAEQIFMSARVVRIDANSGDLDENEVVAFIGKRYLITVRPNDCFDMAPVVEQWDHNPRRVEIGVGYLLYALLDSIVDTYFDAVETFDGYYEKVSDLLFEDTPINPMKQREWFEMRRALVRLHRLVFSTREAVNALLRRDHDAIDESLRPYFQDIYDHVIRASESTDELRDLVSTIADTNLSLRDYRQNQVMKKVTSWAAIIAVPTLVTGFYGMNVPYFGFGDNNGVWLSIALIIVLPIVLFVQFKRHDWL